MDYLQYHIRLQLEVDLMLSFKPCYKWITFNTMGDFLFEMDRLKLEVLNLVINGLPSIRDDWKMRVYSIFAF